MSLSKFKKLPISLALASLAFQDQAKLLQDVNAFYYGGESVQKYFEQQNFQNSLLSSNLDNISIKTKSKLNVLMPELEYQLGITQFNQIPEQFSKFFKNQDSNHLAVQSYKYSGYDMTPRWLKILIDMFLEEVYETPKQLGCGACKATSWTIRATLGSKLSQALLVEIGQILCPFFIEKVTDFKKDTCNGIIQQQFGDDILPMIFDELLNEQTLCTFILNLCDMDNWTKIDVKKWVYYKLNKKPYSAKSNDFVNQLYKKNELKFNSKDSKKLKIAFITDLHVDYDYVEGADNDCGKPLCCRSDSGIAPSNERRAGKWGDYQCDLNQITFNSLLSHIKNDIKPDFVFWAGDSIPHNLDSLTFDSNVQIMKNVTKQVVEGLKGIPIIPAIGNHDSYPQDSIKMHIPKENPAINEWAPSWAQFIPDEEQLQNFLNWGYFSYELKMPDGTPISDKPSKVLSLNSNICYDLNFDAFTHFEDPGNMLQWFENELNDLEKQEGSAIVLAHVPNLDECLRQYGKRFHTLVDRYQHIIRFGIYSHIHQEQYQVIRDLVQNQPIGMNFILGSATTYKGKPPNFNVMYVDPETMLPIDFETHTFDLDHANQYDEPKWDLKYDYRQHYDLKDLSPDSFFALSKQIYYNESVAIKYRNSRFMDGPGVDTQMGCQFDCRTIFYCQTVAGDYDEWQFCRDNNKFELFNGEGLASLQDLVNQNWYVQGKYYAIDADKESYYKNKYGSQPI